MRKFLLAAICSMAFAQSAFAINLTFKFDVYSSGPSIYPCNAGLVHAPTGRVCQDRLTGDSCTPGCAGGNTALCPTGTTPESCVCSGGTTNTGAVDNQGGYRLDFLNVKHADWTDNGETASNRSPSKIEAGTTAFNKVFATTYESFGKQLTEMSVNLGSELYGAEYFLDVCYRGPQIDYRDTSVNFALKAKVTVNNLTTTGAANAPKYIEASDLSTRAEVKCYMKDEYEYCVQNPSNPGCHGSTATINPNVDNIPTAIDSLLNSGWNEKSGQTVNDYVKLLSSSNEKTLITKPTMNPNGDKTPRFCVVRYFFKEAKKIKQGNDYFPAFRKWKLQAAEACTYTEINEPVL